MEDQVLKLELSALFLAEGKEYSIEHYQKRIAEIYSHHYTLEKIKAAYDSIEEMVNETQLNIFLLEGQDDMPNYPDQFFEGN